MQTSYFGGDIAGVLLDQGAGYGIVVGFGFFFVFLTIALVFGDYRARGGRHYNSEDFNTAGARHCCGGKWFRNCTALGWLRHLKLQGTCECVGDKEVWLPQSLTTRQDGL